MKILGVIPARYASSRFPGKPLADLLGQSMVERVFRQCGKSSYLTEIVVATDHQEIFDHVVRFGGKASLTSPDHPSGTDRCYETLAQQQSDYDFVVNVQGDEPFIDPAQIDLLCASLDANTELAGFTDAGREYGWQIDHVLSAAAGPSGKVERAAFERMAAPPAAGSPGRLHERLAADAGLPPLEVEYTLDPELMVSARS